MTKSELLGKTIGLITRCKHDLEEILTWDFLTEEEKATFEQMHKRCVLDEASLQKDGDKLGEAILTNTYQDYYANVFSKLRGFQAEKAKDKEAAEKKEPTPAPTPTAVKVAEVKPEEKQTEKEKEATKKGKNWWKYLLTALGAAGLAVAIMIACRSCDKNIDKTITDAPKPDTETEMVLTDEEMDALKGIDGFNMDDVNIEDYNELLEAAKKIQAEMPEDNKIALEEIMYALTFGNLDRLADDKQGAIFREPEEIYGATYNMGTMLDNTNINADDLIKGKHPELTKQELLSTLVNETDGEFNLDKFADAKTDNGYDLYKVLEICGAGIDLQDEEKATQYATVLLDLGVRAVRNFSIPSTASENDWSYLYTVIGMINANRDRLVQLTAGRGWSTRYGDGIRNDGTYGDLCVEEFLASIALYNQGGTYCGPGKVKLYVDANDYEWPEGYVYAKDGKYYTNFVTARDENGNVLKTETYEVTYSREVDPSAMLARDGDYMNAICDISNKGIGR